MITPQFIGTDYDNDQPGTNASHAWAEPPQVLLRRFQSKVEQVLVGKQAIIRQLLIAMLAGGHVLLEDIPGVGKTMLAGAVARTVGGEFKRIQFTSDMLPADVTGGLVLDGRSGELQFRPGPIMANVVLADEINRTSPRTQSALLEAMEERRVTVEGKTRRLPVPFMLIATQNPLDFEGTNRLPEAQMDRFMMRLSIGYPGTADEKTILEQYALGRRMEPDRIRPVMAPQEWLQMQAEARQAHVHPSLFEYMVAVADATRRSPGFRLGLSPRALRDWLRAAQAAAYIEGRGYVIPDDLLSTAEPVLSHRLAARGGRDSNGAGAASFIATIIRSTPFPPEAGAVYGSRGRR